MIVNWNITTSFSKLNNIQLYQSPTHLCSASWLQYNSTYNYGEFHVIFYSPNEGNFNSYFQGQNEGQKRNLKETWRDLLSIRAQTMAVTLCEENYRNFDVTQKLRNSFLSKFRLHNILIVFSLLHVIGSFPSVNKHLQTSRLKINCKIHCLICINCNGLQSHDTDRANCD